MNDLQKTELTLAASTYLANLNEQTSVEFMLLVKRATNITANVNKMHVEKASDEAITTYINESSKDIGILTMLTGHDAGKIMEESDKFYEFMLAEAANLVKDRFTDEETNS